MAKGKKKDKKKVKVDAMSGQGVEEKSAAELSMTPKQIRARARRRGSITREELELVYKPLEEWDMEELARGRIRNSRGKFSGTRPTWITSTMLEEADKRFKELVKSEMGTLVPGALTGLATMLNDTKMDPRGRPIVPPSVKVDIAKFLLEHAVGKPKQEVQQDISVRLQGILATVMVNPTPGKVDGSAGYGREIQGMPGYVHSALSAPVIEADIVDDEDIIGGGDG